MTPSSPKYNLYSNIFPPTHAIGIKSFFKIQESIYALFQMTSQLYPDMCIIRIWIKLTDQAHYQSITQSNTATPQRERERGDRSSIFLEFFNPVSMLFPNNKNCLITRKNEKIVRQQRTIVMMKNQIKRQENKPTNRRDSI